MAPKHGRHTPAFLLLFLDKEPAYGAALLLKMQTELPYCFSDSAIVYRSLKEMEKHDLVVSSWETPDTGAPRKWYAITSAGKEALAEYAEDIRQRQENFSYFIAHYKKVADPGDLGL